VKLHWIRQDTNSFAINPTGSCIDNAMLKLTKPVFAAYLFSAMSFVLWFRADLAFRNGVHVVATNLHFILDLLAKLPLQPGPAEFKPAPLVPLSEFSLMLMLAGLAASAALAGLYFCRLGFRAKTEPQWYVIPGIICISLLFLTARLAYWAL